MQFCAHVEPSSSSSLRCSAAPHLVSCVRPPLRRSRRRGPRSDSSFLRRSAEQQSRFCRDLKRTISSQLTVVPPVSSFSPSSIVRPSFSQRTPREFFRRSEPLNSQSLPPDGGCGDSQPSPSVDASDLTVVYCNVSSCNAQEGELSARISLFPSLPTLSV